MLVPPLELKFRTRREAGADGFAPTELMLTGHFVCLVDRNGPKGARFAFDDKRAEYGALSRSARARPCACNRSNWLVARLAGYSRNLQSAGVGTGAAAPPRSVT